MSLKVLFVDFNSYFASVEQQENPDLRGVPVGVVPMMADTTCCIAASYEAKRYGVKTGTMVAEARKRCPGIRLIEANHTIYVKYHQALVEAVESCVHVSQVMSIDEMACELPTNFREEEKAVELAHKIKKAVANRVGSEMKSSIGIASNVFLAKTASDMQKPDGLVVLRQQELPENLYGLELGDLCGIGRNMLERLQRYGIFTVKALCQSDKEKLRQVWGGIEGERMFDKLRGKELPQQSIKNMTIGHSHVLPPDKRNPEAAYGILNRLLQKAATRLRKAGCLAGGLHLSLKYRDREKWKDDMVFQETDDTLELIRILSMIWARRENPDANPMAVGVTLFNLVSQDNRTLPLFGAGKGREKLNQVMDRLNEKMGKNTVYYGGAIDSLKEAPMRIAFTHIPDLDVESDD